MAPAGQEPTHAPQPLQRLDWTRGVATPPGASTKITASSGHSSRQVRQTIPRAARHLSSMIALARQGAFDLLSKTGSGHAAAQAPQNVQAPRAKSSSGKPPSPQTTIRSGQTGAHRRQRVQRSVNRSARAHGGRIGCGRGGRPRSNERRARSGADMALTPAAARAARG